MIKIGKYRHYKGKEYEVLYLAKNGNNGEKNLEDLVVYKQLADYGDFKKGQIWVRSLDEFDGFENVNGKIVKRFEFVG